MSNNYGLQTKNNSISYQLRTDAEGFIKNQTGSADLSGGTSAMAGAIQIVPITPILVPNHCIFAHKLVSGADYGISSGGMIVEGNYRVSSIMFKYALYAHTVPWQIASLSDLIGPREDQYGIQLYNEEKRNLVNINESLEMLRLIRGTEFENLWDNGPDPTYLYAEDAYSNYFCLTPPTFGFQSVEWGGSYLTFTYLTLINIIDIHTLKIFIGACAADSGGTPGWTHYTTDVGKIKLLEFKPL